MELSLKGPENWLVNRSDFPQSGLVLRESWNCPSPTCYFPVVLTPAPPSGDLGPALPALHSPPVAVISLVVDRGRGLPETKHWPGAEPASQPHPHLPLGKLTVHGKSSLTGITWASFPGPDSQPSEREGTETQTLRLNLWSHLGKERVGRNEKVALTCVGFLGGLSW